MGLYDEAALQWIYGTETARQTVMAQDFLYCTDEHRARSPLCTAHDLGITPSQITLNAIERYDWQYKFRNRRAYRTFWDTSGYVSRVYDGIFPLSRMWYMGIFDWSNNNVQDTLKRLDQISGTVQPAAVYEEAAQDMINDMTAANAMITAFYSSVLSQSASSRNYQTEYDPYFGDMLRLGIIVDKLFATVAFMGLQKVSNYNPNVDTFAAMYDKPFGETNRQLAMHVLDNMLGAGYDTFPWFKFLAVNVFAQTTNTNLVDHPELKERIAIQRFARAVDMEEVYPGALAEASAVDNPSQVFLNNGEEYVYSYLADRNWHLVARKSRSPVSYQFIRDYNTTVNSGGNLTTDTYGIKTLLAYYEYYNTFSGK